MKHWCLSLVFLFRFFTTTVRRCDQVRLDELSVEASEQRSEAQTATERYDNVSAKLKELIIRYKVSCCYASLFLSRLLSPLPVAAAVKEERFSFALSSLGFEFCIVFNI